MSEKIYAWLLRLYPSRFREAYSEEALQLFRDRSRDETGFLSRLRLWADLFSDLALSVPREYVHVQPGLTSFSADLRPEGVPSFFVFADEPLGRGALFFGGVLSIAALVTCSALLNHGVKYVPLSALIHRARSSANARSSAFDSRRPETAKNTEEGASEPKGTQLPETASVPSQLGKGAPDSIHGSLTLNVAERRRVVDAAIANLKRHYADADVAQKMAESLTRHERNGDDDAARDGRAFADLLTRQMRDVSHDMHLGLVYSQHPLPPQPSTEPPPEAMARYREAMERENCTFETVKIVPQNIGYLKLDSFPDISVCQSTAVAAMARLNRVDAIIFDLRDNRGGFPAMTALIAGYLFDHPEYWYNPRENTTEKSWTQSPVPGNRLADKPVYILISRRTISGAEQFTYNLKMLKRATLVGETTSGAAHAGVFYRIDEHFGMGIPEVKPINPFSKTDWEGTGVEPDAKVNAADALDAAMKLVQTRLQKK